MIIPAGESMTRNHWWEPYTWDRHGIGMAHPLEMELSDFYGIKDKQVRSVMVYGLKGEEKGVVPLEVVLNFKEKSLVFAPAFHGADGLYIMNKDRSKGRRLDGFGFMRITPEEPGYCSAERSGNEKFPADGVTLLEAMVEDLSSRLVRELTLDGSQTLAVGYLPHVAHIKFGSNYCLNIRAPYPIEKDNFVEIFGVESDLSIYPLVVEGGKMRGK